MQADTPAQIASPQPGASLSVWVYQLLSRGFSTWNQAMQQRRHKVQLRTELQSLESRELADLGIGRGELDYWLTETQPGARTKI
ncbi:DUF1127 domain-containing protein [Paucibacter sp. Y2R2-4]|uniref:DUF1127 domain-containing protein n=1 Tax=Paucibacter sp. Y2R2-4 TaxID=2893553 RepID=UPI0021E40BA7|nr:DUF1127 domain-containing protein [Paucibacter sp. Y2R2-4]MCV2352287.1 DUF1127 domain-containing protein [Paucibacter sp. Y2R2-4]